MCNQFVRAAKVAGIGDFVESLNAALCATRMCIYKYVCVCQYAYMCACVFIEICMYVCLHIHMYYVRMHVCIHQYTHKSMLHTVVFVHANEASYFSEQSPKVTITIKSVQSFENMTKKVLATVTVTLSVTVAVRSLQ